MAHDLNLWLASAGLAVVALSSLPAIISIALQLRRGKPRDRFYEDADGSATPETLGKFSNLGVKTVILLFALLGVGTSVSVLAVPSTLHEKNWLLENGLLASAWGFILIHAVCIVAHHSSVKSHTLGGWLLLSTLLLAALSIPRLTEMIVQVKKSPEAVPILRIGNVAVAIALAALSSLLPRKPAVVFQARKVDDQSAVSAMSKYTFSWIEPLIRLAIRKGDLDTDDLDGPDHVLRSEDLQRDWAKQNFHNTSLVSSLVWAYRGELAFLWSLTFVRGFVSILPYWTMLRIIEILENRSSRNSSYVELLVLVGGMAFFSLIDAWIESWAMWYSGSDLSLPIRSQISGLVFAKSLRRKNVKGVDKADSDDKNEEQDVEDAPEDDASVLKSRQAIVNLVGVDLERIFHFVQFHFLIINGFIKLFLFSGFLVQLIGWIPFLAGIAAWVITLPLNTWFSKRLLVESNILMKRRDEKLAQVSEALTGIRQIKFSALESDWEKRIINARNDELHTLWRYFLADSGLFGCWVISPILLAATCLAVYVLLHGSLLPSVAFVSIGVFNTLQTTLAALPELITSGLECVVSSRRLNTYLNGEEKTDILTEGPEISLKGAYISWPADAGTAVTERFILHDLNVTFPRGELSVVSGKTGTGKSLLISALIGEADLLEGSIEVPKTNTVDETYRPGDSWIIPGSVAYISQNPWLENGSVRDNILFGQPFDQLRYDTVVMACALRDDLAILTDGDSTELGANGVNLSGGQKWRVTLARAIYSRADILVMDDVFSAVDTHVGRWILEKCLAGPICKGRTRILVTHHSGQVLSEASLVVELADGRIKHAGPPTLDNTSRSASPSDDGSSSNTISVEYQDRTDGGQQSPSSIAPKEVRKFVPEEVRAKGTVKMSVYLAYLQSSGGLWLWAIAAGIFISHEVAIVFRSWWLRLWTAQTNNIANSTQMIHQQGNLLSPLMTYQQQHWIPQYPTVLVAEEANDVGFYLSVYVAISAVAVIAGLLRFFWGYLMAIKASKTIFENMLFRVLRSPLRWLDTVPTGRIINRFTADLHTIDERIILSWGLCFMGFLNLCGICVATLFASVTLLPPAIVLLGIGALVGARYLAASRPLKRLESNAKSPVFELFNTTLTGISTIRSFQRTESYLAQMHSNLDTWAMTSFYMALSNRWMGFRMAVIAALFCVTVGLVIIFNPSIDAALAGFALSFILDFSESIRFTIRYYGDMELDMNSMERATEYMTLDTEPLDGEKVPSSWPSKGTIEVNSLEVAYAHDLPPVLKNLSFSVAHNERVGVVGRTGAGKSSLTLALFRFLDRRSGNIVIDGLDTSNISLHDLRSRLSIIPQDPVLFSGTVRSNLDPFDNHTDSELFDALTKVQLVGTSENTGNDSDASSARNGNIFQDFQSPISEAGGNLSQGQRQLLCIARAIVSRPKIIVLDEATSAVDSATDTLIQQSIRQGFTDSTLLVIAHRLGTVADFDKILVLDKGQMAEFGTPRELWERDGVFRSMCENSTEKEKLAATILA